MPPATPPQPRGSALCSLAPPRPRCRPEPSLGLLPDPSGLLISSLLMKQKKNRMRLTKPRKLGETPRSCLEGQPRTEHTGGQAHGHCLEKHQLHTAQNEMEPPGEPPSLPSAQRRARGQWPCQRDTEQDPPHLPAPLLMLLEIWTRDPRGPGRSRKQGKLLEAELNVDTCPHVSSSTNHKRHQVESAQRPVGLDGQQDASPHTGVSPAPAGARSPHARPQGRTEPTTPRQTQEAPPGVSPRSDTPRPGSSEAGKDLAGAGEGETADGPGLPAGDLKQSRVSQPGARH